MTRIYVASANEFAWGASEALWTSAVPHLLADGIEVVANVKAWPREAPVIALLVALGCEIIRRPDSAEERGRAAHDLPYTERHAPTLAAAGPDLVLVNQGDTIEGLGWMEACLDLGLPYLVLSHSASDQRWPADDLAARLRRGYLGAVQASFVSEHNLALLQRQIMGPIPGADIVASTLNVPIDSDLEWTSGDPVRMAMVGRLDPDSKGQDVVFELMGTPTWRRRPVVVDVYGEGHCGQVLRALRDYLQLTNVEFRGFTDDVEGIWRTHEVLLLPSRVEGLPTVVIEAMLCGRVVVAADAGGVRELVTDDEDGFVAAAATVESMGDALERSWRRRSEWPAIGRQAKLSMKERRPRDPARWFADRLRELVPQPEGRDAG